ncbi:soluble lamin-associated protein of 75 kDa isoform X1 [Arapaima gigas]
MPTSGRGAADDRRGPAAGEMDVPVMEFPVDILATMSHGDVEQSAEDYLSDLLHSNPDEPASFALSGARQVPITVSSVGFVPMYGADLVHKVLALFAPEDPFTAVALYLAGQWWAVEDVLKTADHSRTGLLKVKTLGERVVLYALNRIVYRAKEINKNEVPFLCHHHSDYAKILWKDGEAIGFYSVKPKGSLCTSFLTQRYLLPVMDSIFVRKAYRGQGHGLQILEDFVDTFKEDTLGLKFPLSHAMYKVCERYLGKYPADEDLLWEVQSVGGPFQRTKISSKIESLSARVNHRATVEASVQDTDQNEVLMDEETTPGCVMISEEVTVNCFFFFFFFSEEITVSTHNDLRRKRLRENSENVNEATPKKINRVMDTMEKPVLEEEEEQLVPADKEVAVAPKVHFHDEPQAVEAHTLQGVEPDQVNGELISREKETVSNEAAGEPTLTLEEEIEDQNDENQEEVSQEALGSKDIVGAVDEEPDEGLTEKMEEASSLVEKVTRSPRNEASLPEESEGHLQIQAKALLLVEEETSMQMVDKDPIAMEGAGGGSFVTEGETSSLTEVVSASSLEEGNEMVKNKDEQEPGTPVLEVSDEDLAGHFEMMPGEEAINEKLSSYSEPVKKDDAPAEPCSSLDGAQEDQVASAVDLSQDTVLLVGLKEVSYQQSIPNANIPQSEEMKPNEETEGNALEMEDMTRSENDMEVDVKIKKENTKKEEEASAVEEEPDSLEKSSDETNEPPVVNMRVLRRKNKQIKPKPKLKSMRKKVVNYSDEAEQAEASEEPEVDNEEEVLEPKAKTTEEKPVEAEDERTTTTEEEAEERSSDDEDDPPVVDRRVLRRKTKIIQSTPRTKAKRHGKT